MEACPSSTTPPSSSMETPTSVKTESSPSFIFLDNDPIPHPVRPGKSVCPMYKYYGRCNSGALCIFDHPKGLQPLYTHKKKGKREKNQQRIHRAFTSEQLEAHWKRAHETEETTYKFVKLIRVNARPVSGVLYYITFQAEDGKLAGFSSPKLPDSGVREFTKNRGPIMQT